MKARTYNIAKSKLTHHPKFSRLVWFIFIEICLPIFKGNDLLIQPNSIAESEEEQQQHLFSVESHQTKNGILFDQLLSYILDQYYLTPNNGIKDLEENPQNQPFLIVRSLKENDGTQKVTHLFIISPTHLIFP